MPIEGGHDGVITADQVAVAVTKGGFPHHAGLLFRDKDKRLLVLHLLNHRKMKAEPYPGERAFGSAYCWVVAVLDLPLATSRTFVGNLRKIAKRQGEKIDSPITYGVKVLESHGSFTTNGDYFKPKKSNGLTCATFVTELIGSIGLRILKEDTWPEGVNGEWIAAVGRMLRQEGAEEAHVKEVESCVNARRIRPAEVLVGGTFSFKTWPKSYQEVQPDVPKVDAALDTHCGGLQRTIGAVLAAPPG